MAKKRIAQIQKRIAGNIRLAPMTESNVPISKEGARELARFTRAFFDRELQDKFEGFLTTGDVKVKGRKSPKGQKPVRVDLTEISRYENPAIANVQASLGVYNPEQITVETFDLMKKDPTVSMGLAFIKLPIIALPWRIDCENDNIRNFLEHTLKRVWRRLIKSTLTAVDYGFASHEKVFAITKVNVTSKKKDGKKKTYYKGRALVYKKFKAHHPSSIEVLLDEKENFNGITQTSMNGEIPLKKDKCFFFTHDEEFGNPFGKSRLVAAYKYWYWKEVLYQFMLMYFERRGSPPVVTTVPPGESQTQAGNRVNNMQLGLDLGASLLSNTIAVIPYEESKNGKENMWKIDYLTDDKRGEMFIQAINHLDVCTLRALWIPEKAVTNEGSSGGSYGLGSIHADLFLQSELGLINDIEAAIDDQVLPILVDANFVPDEREPAYLKLDSLDWNRKIALKEIFIEMMRNIDNMVQTGLKPRVIPSFEDIAKVLNVPVEAFDKEVSTDLFPPGTQQGNQQIGQNAPLGAQNKPLQPQVGPRAVPRRAKRESFTGSREADRKVLRPGGKRAENIRAKLSMPEIGAFGSEDTTKIADAFEITKQEDGTIRFIDMVRIKIMQKAMSGAEGLMAVKSGLMRLKIWTNGIEYIPQFELMGPEDIVRAIRYMMDFHIEILHEAMSRKLSDDSSFVSGE